MRNPALTTLALAVALPIAAAASADALEGVFAYAHPIGMGGYANKKACTADQGRWESGHCVFDASDTVEVKKDDEGYLVTISTITTNAHTCDFSARGALVSPQEIAVSADSRRYVDDGGGKYHFEPVRCELRVTYAGKDAVGVKRLSDADSCEDFCGMNAGLEIERAERR